MISLLYRSCEGNAWRQVASVRTLAVAADEIASWQGPHLSHGDLVRVVASADHRRRVTPRLYVCDVTGETETLRTVPIDAPSWDAATDAEAMLRRCERVDKRRVVMTACDIARVVLPLVPAGEDRPRVAVETAERWCCGGATVDEVEAVRSAAVVWAVEVEVAAAARAAVWAASAAARAAVAAAEAARAAVATENDPFLLRVLRACEGEHAGTRRADYPLRSFDEHWTAQRFERDETGWPTVKEYDHDGRNCDRDKVSLRNGQTRYFRDDRGRLQRGTVYTNMNSMWMVVFGGSVTYMSGCCLFSCERPDIEPRRVMPGQKKRLRDELAKASAASDFRRVEVLARVLRGFSETKGTAA